MFAVSLVASPLLASVIHLSGLFAVTGATALACIAVIAWWTPSEPNQHRNMPRGKLSEVLRDSALLRFDVGVFVLHAVQLAMWVALPALLVQAGLPKEHHWWVYLPAVIASFLVMGVTLFPLERRGYLRAVFLGAIALVAVVQLGLAASARAPGLATLSLLLFVFFCGFNVLEASQPSMTSRVAPAHARGAALGVYNTLQSVGFFFGGAVGGWLAKNVGDTGLFATCAALMVLWLVVAWPMKAPAPRRTAEEVLADDADAQAT
jgi:predicted MFS family arabinose efflux permease